MLRGGWLAIVRSRSGDVESEMVEVIAIVPPCPGCAKVIGSCSTQPVLGETGPPAHTTAEDSPRQLISRLSSSSLALIGLGWLTTSPNEPCGPCSIIRTTAREKLGSRSCGMASSNPGARLEDSSTQVQSSRNRALPPLISSLSWSREHGAPEARRTGAFYPDGEALRFAPAI